MKDRNERNERNSEREKKVNLKDKRAWMGLASACVAVALAVVLVIAFADDRAAIDAGNVNPPASDTPGDVQQPAVEEDLGMGMPVDVASVSNEFGFFYNQTLDCYYHHEGMDFVTEAGTEVLAAEDGVVESIYTGDMLKGTEIVISHGDGLKTLYRFVTAAEGLSVGDTVRQGDVIAVVAEATGDEYRDGAHLHFEVLDGGFTVDPTLHLPMEEK